MIILSSLGTGGYREATYISEQHSEAVRTGLFAEAVHKWYPEAHVVILATEGAFNGINGKYVREHHPDYQIEMIPDGRNELEAWGLFKKISDPNVIPTGEKVIFDITHGLRSLPMFGFLALSYLRVVRQVQIERVIYGALELTPKVEEGKIALTPVIDLTPMISLLDWAQAAKRFQDTGDASLFQDLLSMKREANYNAVSRQLTALSKNIQANRGLNIGLEAEKLMRVLEFAKKGGLETHQHPFSLITEQLEKEIKPLVIQESISLELTLKAQHALIHWYAERNHYPQAMSLAREWMISVRQWREHNFISMEENEREHINDDCKAAIKANQERDKSSGAILENLPECLWKFAWANSSIVNLRNDLMHFGFKLEFSKMGTLKQKVENALSALPAAVLPLGLNLEEKPKP